MKGEFVEPHSEKKGRLGGKFEDYTHTPSDAVWDRIAEQPADRPLGAMFMAFAWVPKPRVWRRISAALHPVPYMRIALWTTAAAAAVAILLLFQWSKPMAPSGTGNGFASSSSDRAAHAPRAGEQGEPKASQADLNAGNTQAAVHKIGPSSLPKGPQNAATQDSRRYGGLYPGVQPVAQHNPSVSKKSSGTQSPFQEEHLTASDPIFAHIEPRSVAAIAPNLQAIDMRSTFFAMMNLERQKEALLAMEADILQHTDDAHRAELSGLMAQAGTNLSAGGIMQGKSYELEDLASNSSLDFGISANELSSRKASTEEFQTPLVIGALVEHGIAPHVALGGGIVYTKMQSSEHVGLGTVSQRIDYTRQYLGLATQATYSISLSKRSDRLGLYGMAGLQYDFGLGKHSRRETIVQDVATKSVENEALGGQASVNGGLGLRYALLKRMSLYAQGTGSCYFYASEANLYTQKIIWPSMQIGLRLAL
jgi:hypothetical protein